MLKIYGRRNSINVQKVMWTVAELALPHERVDAGMKFGVVGEAWYGDLNPNRLVPTIDDDGVVIWESNTIVRYLAAKHAAGTLMPTDIGARANAEKWMDWQQCSLMYGLGPLFINLVRTPPEKRDLSAIASGEASVVGALKVLDANLKGRAYLLAEGFTVADIPAGAAAHRWYALPIDHPDLPSLRAWYDRLTQRPAFQQHVMLPLS